MTQPVFLVGTGRCGSTFLSDVLGSHEQILSISELWAGRGNLATLLKDEPTDGRTFWKDLCQPLPPDHYKVMATGRVNEVVEIIAPDDNPILRITLPKIAAEPHKLYRDLNCFLCTLPVMSKTELLEHLFRFLRESQDCNHCVERTGVSLRLLPYYKKLWRRLRVIHILRDGRTCAVSMSQHPVFQLYVKRLLAQGSFDLVNMTPLLPASFDMQDLSRQHVSLFGWFWNQSIMQGFQYFRNMPQEDLLQIKYESLLVRPKEELERVVEFVCPGESDNRWIDRMAATVRPGNSDLSRLSSSDVELLTQACSEGLRAFDYL